MDHTTTCTSAEMEMFTHKQFSKRLSIPSKPPVSPAHISVGYTRRISEARINRAGIVKAKTDAQDNQFQKKIYKILRGIWYDSIRKNGIAVENGMIKKENNSGKRK
ncbi:hypothetical protein Tco_0364841 [Tanacetum coccineum]